MEVPSEACQKWCTHQADDDTVVRGDESTSYMLTGSNAAHDEEDCNSGHNDGDDEEIDTATIQMVIARFNDTHAARRRHHLIHNVASDSNRRFKQVSLILREIGQVYKE